MQPRQTFSNADLLSAGASLCYIYTLHASNDPECRPRYVGFTCRPKYREREHHRMHKNGRNGEWIDGLLAIGERAILTVIHTFRSNNLSERILVEATWIELYRSRFPDLLNDAGGGVGVAKPSAELRKRKSDTMKRVCADPLVKKQRSELMKRRYADPVERKRLNEINKLRFSDPIERKKRSDSQKCRWADPKEREKQREVMKRCVSDPNVQKNYRAAMAKLKFQKILDAY